MKESWKAVEGFEGYQVSSLGRVKRRERVLKAWPTRCGYLLVRLYKNGLFQDWSVHRLVYSTFHKGLGIGKEINHKDGNKRNNRIENLEQVTRSENIKHAFKLGLNVAQRGEKHKLAKLTEQDIKEIRAAEGTTQRDLAKKYGVSQPLIGNILRRETWKHVK